MIKITRDKFIFLLTLVGMSLSLAVIFNGFQLINNWIAKMESIEGTAKYTSYIKIYSTTGMNRYDDYDMSEYYEIVKQAEDSTSEIIQHVNQIDCNAVIVDGYAIIGDNTRDTETVQIVVSYDGTWNRVLTEGRYPTLAEWNSDNIYLVAGSGWQDDAYMDKDGDKSLLLEGQDCKVLGWLDSFGDETDKTILIFASLEALESNDTLFSRISDTMTFSDASYTSFTLELLDENTPVDGIADNLIETFASSGAYYGVKSDDYDDDMNLYLYYQIKLLILILLYVVGIVNCVMIARVWFVRQRRDIAIMKTIGITDSRIVGWQVVKMLSMMGISCVAAMIINVIYVWFTEKRFNVAVSSYSILYLAVSVVIMLAVMLFPLFRLLDRLVPAQELEG